MSHFSDSDIADKSFAEIQLKRFQEIRAKLLGSREHDERPLLCHMASSAATLSEMAIKGSTIPYEILTTMGGRSRRIYV